MGLLRSLTHRSLLGGFMLMMPLSPLRASMLSTNALQPVKILCRPTLTNQVGD